MEYYSTIESMISQGFSAKQTEPEDVSEINYAQKDKYPLCSLICPY